MKILFMGTPDFARESLEAVYNSGYEIIGVVTNPDKPKGRGMKMIPSPVKEFAIEKNIPVYQPLKVRNNEEFLDEVRNMNPDVICVVAYGKILPQELLDIPRMGSINVHGSLLPKYRGAAPIQWAVLNGDKTTGITTMYMDAGMDTGDMILKQEVEIGENETTGELWDRLAKIGGELLVKTLKQIENGTAPRTKQGEEFTVRGLNPIMGAFSFINGKKIKLWKVDILSYEDFTKIDENINAENLQQKENGEVVFSDSKKGLFIKAKDGIIKVLEIQGENAKKMPIGDFLRGNNIKIGEKFV